MQKQKAIKKKTLVIIVMFVAVIAVFSACMFINSISNRKTGGLVKHQTVTFPTLFRSQVGHPTADDSILLTLEFENWRDSGIMPLANQVFTVNKDGFTDIVKLCEEINKARSDTGISAEIFREFIIIRTALPDLQYAIVSRSLNSDTSFDYAPMQAGFFEEGISEFRQIDGDNFAIYFPYHLFEDNLLYFSSSEKNHELSLQIGHSYRIYGTADDFREFYESLGLYEITKSDNQLILEGQVYIRDASWLSADVTSVNGRVILDFKEENGYSYVSFDR